MSRYIYISEEYYGSEGVPVFEFKNFFDKEILEKLDDQEYDRSYYVSDRGHGVSRPREACGSHLPNLFCQTYLSRTIHGPFIPIKTGRQREITLDERRHEGGRAKPTTTRLASAATVRARKRRPTDGANNMAGHGCDGGGGT
jgi:hypothetical protein